MGKSKVNWKEVKDDLKQWILVENVAYEEIGRRLGVTGASVRKYAKRLGIELPPRRSINECETFNKGKKKIAICLNCGKEFFTNGVSNRKYCCLKCQREYEYKQYIAQWKSGTTSGEKGIGQVSNFVRRYLMDKYNNSCQRCGWNEVNPYTGLVPLQIHHINGDCTNNREENLQLLCPNCHSLTENFGILNKSSKRFHRQKNTLQDGVISSSEQNA